MGFSKQTPLLKIIIIFDENNNASLELEKLHPQLKSPEYIRIALHFYAKMLVTIDPNQSESAFAYLNLLSVVDAISNANLKNNPDVLKIADINDVVKLSVPSVGKLYCYTATLFGISGLLRHLITDIPAGGFLQHMSFAIPILVQGILKYLDTEEIEILQRALKNMNQQYYSGFDFKDMAKWESIPINAFLSSIVEK